MLLGYKRVLDKRQPSIRHVDVVVYQSWVGVLQVGPNVFVVVDQVNRLIWQRDLQLFLRKRLDW